MGVVSERKIFVFPACSMAVTELEAKDSAAVDSGNGVLVPEGIRWTLIKAFLSSKSLN